MTMYTLDEATEYLSDRAATYGGELSDILNRTPTSMWDNPNELVQFWEGRDLSHIFPQSTHPWLIEDWGNIIAEDPSVNAARGAEVMTPAEQLLAEMDNEVFATTLDVLIAGDDAEVLAEVIELAGA